LTTRRPLCLKLLLLIGITLLAAFLRLYKIDSLPPSAGYDQADYGLDALAIIHGERPIFIPTKIAGREALFSYLAALSFLVSNDYPTAIYVLSAVIGILTIPAIYLAADEMFSTEEGPLAQWGGLLTALVAAILHWHLSWSRLGMRVILVPLFAALIVYFLWRGLHTGNRWMFAACGFFLGFSMYTYQAARILPMLVLLVFACVLWSRRSFSKRDGLNLALIAVVALVIFAPLGYYFLTHPGSSGQRIEQALVVDSSQDLPAQARAVFDQIIQAALTFSIKGDQDPRVTIPGRPALNPFLSLFFLLGIGISLLRIKRPLYFVLLAWLVLMGVPAMLAQYGAVTKRALGAFPAVVMLIIIGLLVLCDALRRRITRRLPSWSRVLSLTLPILIAAGFIYTGVATYRDYFIVWARNPNLFIHFEAGLVAVGEYIGELPPGEQVYLSPPPPEHPSIVLHSGQRENVRGYNGRVCLVLPASTAYDTTYVIIPDEDKNSLDLLAEYFSEGGIVDEGPLYYHQPYFLAYRVPAEVEVRVEPSHRLEANWDNRIGLLGYDLDAPAYEAGETIRLTLYYRGLSEMATNYTVFTQLWGLHNPATGGPVWGQDDGEPCRRCYPTSSWGVGEVVIDKFVIAIPDEAPSGDYDLAMGFYQWPSLERLPVLDVAGQTATDNAVILGQVHITGHD
jgi:hypothetical protein